MAKKDRSKRSVGSKMRKWSSSFNSRYMRIGSGEARTLDRWVNSISKDSWCPFWADCILIYTHHLELVKSVGTHGQSSLLFVMKMIF
jgi:hypothetical protein